MVCVLTDTKLEEHKVKEEEVTKILTEVSVAKREAEIVSPVTVPVLTPHN